MTLLNSAERCLVSFAPVITLIAVWPNSNPGDTFAAPKIYGFAIIVCLLSFLRLLSNYRSINIISTKKFLQDKSNLIPIASILGIIGSSAYSVDPLVSYFGDQNTQIGGFAYLLCIIYIFLCATSRVSASYMPTLLISILVSVIAMAEFVGFRPLSELVEQKYTIKGFFPIAFTGYRGHLAGLFCIMVGLSIFLILKTNFTHTKDGQVSYSNYSKIIHSNHHRPIYTYTNLVITSTCIFLISNTSAIIGAVSAFVMALLILKRRLNIVTLAINLILIMSSIQIVKSFGDYAMKSGWVAHTATSEDLSTTSTLKTRLILWESAINLFKQRPILGWGQNTYENLWYTSISKNKGDKLLLLELGLDDNIVFSRINDSIAYKDSNGITKPQRLIYSSSHNAYLDLLYSSGLIGFASVILLSFYIVKKLKYPLPSIAFSISYLVYLAAWFPVSTNLLPFVCLIGIMLSESQREL